MVNRGRSWGCRMCKQRRIKCDETEPYCKRCTKSGLACPGYELEKPLKIRFKDETALVTSRSAAYNAPHRGPSPLPHPSLHETFESKAYNFFILYFATSGRSKDSSRGFWENVVPTLEAVPISSPANEAATAVGGILFNVWRLQNNGPGARNPAFNRALRKLRSSLETPGPINGPEVLMTILLLQFHENVSAVFGLRTASRVHYNGALALLRNLPVESFATIESRGLLLNVLNIEVSLAIRECQPVDPELVPWIASLPYTMPTNPALRLTYIGITVADIQHRFEYLQRVHSYCHGPHCEHSADIRRLYHDILDFQIQAHEWVKDIPEHWTPHVWEPAPEVVDAQFPMYNERCEIYPSIQIASVTNTWRGYRLIICKFLVIMHHHGWLPPESGPRTRFPPYDLMQSLTDSLCYSIPFYLGDRTEMLYMHDLTGSKSTAFYPAYHNMHNPPIEKEHILSEEEHMRHTVAYGTWHCMYPLTRLVTIFSPHSPSCSCVSGILRPGQIAWIGAQLLRIMKIFGLDRVPGSGDKSGSISNSLDRTVNAVQAIARSPLSAQGASESESESNASSPDAAAAQAQTAVVAAAAAATSTRPDPEDYARSVRSALRFVYTNAIAQLQSLPDDGAIFVIPIVDPTAYRDRFPDFAFSPGDKAEAEGGRGGGVGKDAEPVEVE